MVHETVAWSLDSDHMPCYTAPTTRQSVLLTLPISGLGERRDEMTRVWTSRVLVLWLPRARAGRSPRADGAERQHLRYREGRLWWRPARRHRRSASPALIEQSRTVVTDDQGVYRIVRLVPGVYTVTFTLPGFGSVRREGLELTTGFTAHGQRRPQRGLARRNPYGLGCRAAGRHAERHVAERVFQKVLDWSPAALQDHPQLRPAHRRRDDGGVEPGRRAATVAKRTRRSGSTEAAAPTCCTPSTACGRQA